MEGGGGTNDLLPPSSKSMKQSHKDKISLTRKRLLREGKLLLPKKLTDNWKSGPDSSFWKGGRTISNGYVFLNLGHQKVVREHRLVMEKHLKRKLKTEEVVHHINGIRNDNRIENLALVSKSINSSIRSPLINRMRERIILLESLLKAKQ